MHGRAARIVSVGTAVPDNVVTNKELSLILDTTDEWITSRTGIRQRHISPRENPVSAAHLGALASQKALKNAGISPDAVDAIICATFTPDYFFPSTACKIQHELGCNKAFGFDISAACAGFVYGLGIADSFIRAGRAKTVLLVGSEIISRTLDWTDRSTCILFGDGAGAVVLQEADQEDRGVLSATFHSMGSMGDILYLPAWGEKRYMHMKGNEVFKNAVRMMSEASLKACSLANLTIQQIDLIIPHQANIRIINGLAEHLGVSMEKMVTNIDRYGNTSSASIPLALEEVWNAGRIKEGTVALFTALGGGIAVGSTAVRF
jgi:3-oxoacyl-[acyl-carrier-protein] synthase III